MPKLLQLKAISLLAAAENDMMPEPSMISGQWVSITRLLMSRKAWSFFSRRKLFSILDKEMFEQYLPGAIEMKAKVISTWLRQLLVIFAVAAFAMGGQAYAANATGWRFVAQIVNGSAQWSPSYASPLAACNAAFDYIFPQGIPGFSRPITVNVGSASYHQCSSVEVSYPNGGYAFKDIYAAPYSFDPDKSIGSGDRCDCGEGSSDGSDESIAANSPSKINDPIDAFTGSNYRQENDYDGGEWLKFRRFYNSSNGVSPAAIGVNWRHSFDRILSLIDSPLTTLQMVRPDGRKQTFVKTNGAWVGDADVADTVTENDDANGNLTGFVVFIASTRHIEKYNSSGRLLSVSDMTGRGAMLTYSNSTTPASVAPKAGLLLTVSDSQGRALSFTYNSNSLVSQLFLPDGSILAYGYDSNANLVSVKYPDGKTKQYTYDEPSLVGSTLWTHALTGVVDEAGQRYESTRYDSFGRAVSAFKAGGIGTATLTYNSNGTALVQYPLGLSTVLTPILVQGVNRVASVDSPCSPQCAFSLKSQAYDANGYLSLTTDFNNNVVSTTFDTAGLLLTQVDGVSTQAQRTSTFTWNSTLRVPLSRTVSDSSGSLVDSRTWAYNAAGQATSQCVADPLVSGAISYICGSGANAPVGVRQLGYTYCAAIDSTQCPLVGLLLTADGPRTDVSDITHFSYYLSTDESGCGTVGGACHRAGDLYQVTDALGHVSTMVAYDKNGRVVRSRDSNNVITDLTYTPRGWLKTRTVGSATTTIDYDAVGNVIKITDADGVFVGYTYDAAHRLTDITDAVGNHIHYTLDAAGNKTKEDTYDSGSTLRRTLSRSYNTLGQLTGVTDGLNHTVFNASYTDSYDANGNLVHTADGLGIQRKQGYDALNRLVSTLDNYNGTDTATQNTQATFAYDALDNLEGVTDPDGLSTTYDYDGLSNPKALHSLDTGTTSFQVDAAGNRIQQTDAKGIVRTTTYDAINRPLTVSYPDSTQNIAYHYDEADSVTGCSGSFPMGRLTRIVETAVTTTYCYDNHGNVTKKTQAQGTQVDTTSYSYTGADRLSSITTPSQTVTQYSRDAAGRISGVTVTPSGGAGQTVVSAISYLPFGPISSYRLGNGQTITRSYDANYQLTDLTSPALNLHFARDVMGNIIALGNTPGANPAVETYNYDPLYHLAGVNDGSGNSVESYTYSKTGDRLSKTKLGGLVTGSYGYDANTHHLTSIGSAARTYDANGNTTGSASKGEAIGYGYNARARMSIVQRNQATVANYTYNALNERVAKVATSPQALNERFMYDEMSRLVGEYGSANRDYIWLDGLPIAVVDSGSAGAINYVHADGNGSPRAITTGAGDAVWQWDFQTNPFGEQPPVGGYVYNLRFPGQYYDAESGLYHNVNRDFEAAVGRYIESDPIGLDGGMNTYAYVANNPYGDIDPLGLACNANGCWNTAAEAGYAKAGNYSVYYQAACQGGDPYACRAGEVAADRDIPDDWLRDFLTHQTNRNLEHSLHEHRPPYMQCDQIEPYIQRQFENIRRGLAKARYQQLLGATPDHPRMVSRSSIADFHHAIFEAYGSDAGTFGGDKWDSMDGAKWSAQIGHGYDWCASPACH